MSKSLDQFYVRKDRADSAQSWCKRCLNKLTAERQEDKKYRAVQAFGGKCSLCGYDHCRAALEFHHRDPTTKTAQWNRMRSWSWQRIMQELAHCDLVCANCHREIEAGLIQ
jgi:predicted HNH restriction endonuclease